MSVFRSAAVVGAMTLLSRAAGLAREVLMAGAFGTSALSSAFAVAFRAPNLLRRLFGEGALSAAFIPVYTETLEHDGDRRANEFASRVAGLLITVLGVAVLFLVLLTYPLGHFCAEGSRWGHILPLLRIMLPYAPLICLAALIMGILNAHRNFVTPALAPVFLNLVWILSLVLTMPFNFSPEVRIKIVAVAILLAGFIQNFVQFPALRRFHVPLRLLFRWRGDAGILRVVHSMAPMALGIGIFEVNTFIDSLLAMYAAEWAPSALEFADRIIYLPLGLFGTSFATVLLPILSGFAIKKQMGAFTDALESAMRSVFLIMLPLGVLTALLARPAVELLYERGNFTEESTMQCVRALYGYAPGLLAFSFYKIIVPPFYALGDTKTPVKIGAKCVGLNFVLNLIFVFSFPRDWKHAGLAMATVVSSFVNCVVLFCILRRRHPELRLSAIRRTFLASFFCSCVMTLAVLGMAQLSFIDAAPPFWRLLSLSTVGLFVYLPTMLFADRSSVREAFIALKLRRKRRKAS